MVLVVYSCLADDRMHRINDHKIYVQRAYVAPGRRAERVAALVTEVVENATRSDCRGHGRASPITDSTVLLSSSATAKPPTQANPAQC